MKNNRFKKTVRIITNNFGLKILSVIVACALWFVVNSITDPLDSKPFYNIPVEIINADLVTNEGNVYEVLDGTDMVNVTVTGKTSMLDISREDIKAVADMSELTFMNTVAIKVSSTRNNADLDFKTNISNVKLSIEKMDYDQKFINASTIGEPAAGYVVGDAKPSPNVVRFSGPESLIDQIDHIDAVANIEGSSSDINTSVELKLYDAENNEIKNSAIKLNITTVNVAVTINATKEVSLDFVVPDEPAAGYVVSSNEMISVPDKIWIAGRSTVLEGISKIVVSDPALSVEGLTEDMTTIVNVKKYLPSGVQFADSSFNGNVSVTIAIEPLETRELRIPARNFAAGGKPDNLKLTLGEVEAQDYYTIRISGTKAAVDAVNAASVIGVVDMDALLEKLGLSEWVAGIYQNEITFNLPDNVTLEHAYQMTVVLEDLENDSDNDEDNGEDNGEENAEDSENKYE